MFNKSYSDRPSFGGRGGKKFGGPRFGGRGFGGDRDEQGGGLHDATCAKCNAHCQVPFRPNGRKPVYCSNCFVRDEQSTPRFERGGYDKSGSWPDKPSYGEKRPYVSTPRNNNAQLETQLKEVNAKLDQILAALNS